MAGNENQFRVRKRHTAGEKAADAGPKTGGILVVSMYQKRDASATDRKEAEWVPSFTGRVIAATGHHGGAPDATVIYPSGVAGHSGVDGGLYHVTNQGRGDTGSGTNASGRAWTKSAAVEAARNFSQGGAAHELHIDGNGAAVPTTLQVSAHLFCAVQDHYYAPDDTYTGPGGGTATTKTGYPYDSLDDVE